MRQASKTNPDSYLHTLPTASSFTGKGILGYSFGPLKQKDLEIYFVEVETGHDTFIVSKKISRTYYVLSGSGYFTIDNCRYDVSPGVLVEVPPKIEYSYSGKMTLLVLSKPRWFNGNDTVTRWNPDVVRGDFPSAGGKVSWLRRIAKTRVLGTAPVELCLRLHQGLWNRLPSFIVNLGVIRSYARCLNILARHHEVRAQAFSTYFLRNRPELELITRLISVRKKGALRVAVLGCSTGAQAYSVAWKIRSERPDLTLALHAVDVSKHAVECAQRGVYSLRTSELTNTNIFDRLTTAEMKQLFDIDGDAATVKPWIKDGIQWLVADVGEQEIVSALGPQDIVVANNFLCHMDPLDAERCLRNIARLVSPGGYLFVSGIDLDIRTKVARELGWSPVSESLEEIHDGDDSCKRYWPCHYGGLEPLNKRRHDWKLRYAAVFQLASAHQTQ